MLPHDVGGGRRKKKGASDISVLTGDDPSVAHSQIQESVYEVIPQEYVFDPVNAEPILHYLPKAMALSNAQASADHIVKEKSSRKGPNSGSNIPTSNIKFPNFRLLLSAADDDLKLHRARVQAGKANDPTLLKAYKIETDPTWLARQQRLNERILMLKKLSTERGMIMKELKHESTVKGLTAAEKTQVQLARWQRALELFVYSPPNLNKDKDGKSSDPQPSAPGGTKDPNELELLGLMENLLEGIAEENEMSEILSQASDMCTTLVDVTKQIVRDASDGIAEVEDAYQIRLEAHEMFARSALGRTEEIQNQFRINGRAALQIGNQLEFAESKRQRCESASILIRRWWLMESLAEQEAMSGQALKVQEEVRGVIPLTSCRLDPLFIRPEKSLEAARALKQLRNVVRCRAGNNAASANTTSGQWEKSDATNSRRFDLTASLVQRTSDALEQRMLNRFSEVYSKGGTYEFTNDRKPRPGTIDWQELRDMAHALLLFDSGRNLHKRYVDMVVSTRFPELFNVDEVKKRSDNDEEQPEDLDEEIDMDATRSKLSSLFHRVSEVCMQEFQLIAYVFGTDRNKKKSSDALAVEASVVAEDLPLTVARALCTRVIGDPKHGLQGRIHDLLESIDRRGDFDTGAKKLDTFVVIHEKAAGLFGLLKDASERLLRRDEHGGDSYSSSATNAVDSLKAFLNAQEIALNSSHRTGYLNLELRLLHHECCRSLQQANCMLMRPAPTMIDQSLLEKGLLQDYQAPLLPLDKESLKKGGFNGVLSGPLKQSVQRQPLIHATDSLARARLMFGTGEQGGETTARVITSIYNQMCTFYGQAFLYPIVESLAEMLRMNPPSQAPQLPFDEDKDAHDLGVEPAFWVGLERVHSAAKSFDREMWAENRPGSNRVWEILTTSGRGTGVANSMSLARECRMDFFTELERRGEDAILRALDTISAHIQWILITGGEAAAASGKGFLNQLTGSSDVSCLIELWWTYELPVSDLTDVFRILHFLHRVPILCLRDHRLRVQIVQLSSP